jgi:hypothetical protein
LDSTHQNQLRRAQSPDSSAAELEDLASSREASILLALIANPSTPADTLRRLAATPRINVRKALLDSPRCPLVSSIAEDRLAFEGIDPAIFVDQSSRRSVCRAIIGTGHRAEADLLFSDPTLRVIDCLRTLHSLFTIHGGKKRDRKLNRHDYLRFLSDFNARGGRFEVLDLPMFTLLTSIRLLGQEGLVKVMTACEPERARLTLRLLEAVVGNPSVASAGHATGDDGEAAHQQQLLQRWIARHDDWPLRLHSYLARKYQRRRSRRKNRAPRALHQAQHALGIRRFNARHAGEGRRVHLPRSERELQALGAVMANCVGSEHNVQDAVDGRHVILHVHPVGARRRGVTCQFSPDGRLLQARGFANADADEALVAFARAAMAAVLAGADAALESA